MSASDYIPSDLVSFMTLFAGVGFYLTVIPEWISRHFGLSYPDGLQVGLILLLFLPISLILGRVTKIMNSSLQTDGGIMVEASHPKRSSPTLWGAFGGSVIGGTLGIPSGTIWIFTGVIVGGVIGIGIEYLYLNLGSILESLRFAIPGMRPVYHKESPAAEATIEEEDDEDKSPLERELEEDIVFTRELRSEKEYLLPDIENFRERIATDELHYEIRPTSWHGWEWMLVDYKGNIRARSSENFRSVRDAVGEINELAATFGEPDIFQTEEVSFDVYEDESGDWRWRLVSESDEVLRESEEGYETRQMLRKAIVEFKENEIEANTGD